MPKNNPGAADVRYEVITQEDPETGDLILPIPPPVLAKMGWKEGDELINPDEKTNRKRYSQ